MNVKIFPRKFQWLNLFWQLLVIMMCTSSCTVQLVPPYDPEIEHAIIDAARQSDRLYMEMINAPDDKKLFGIYKDKYLSVAVEINSLLLRNETRPKADHIVSSITKLKNFFFSAMEDHKKREVLNNAELILYHEQLKAFWKPVLVEEMALKKAM
ncbi:MAG: hypothetical protein ABIW38_03575 [Ferruginibacter sp.]